MEVESVIIGGGVAGSYISNIFNKDKKDFILLEASYKLGGRHLSIKDKKENVLYEAGAWRVHSSHKRMLKLCKKLNLTLEFLEGQHKRDENLQGTKGLSKIDEIILANKGDLMKSFKEELETGYQGTYDASASTNPYSVNTKEGEYYIIKEGQEEIINRLVKDINEDKIYLNHRVQDIVKEKNKYLLTVLYKNKQNQISEKKVKCKYLFSCVAQFDAWSWTIVQKHLYPLLNAVKPLPLMHIYVKGQPPKNIEKLRKIPNSALQQIIPATHNQDWYQISYSAGRVAMFWYNYKLKYGERKMKELLEEYSGLKFERVSSYFWSHAYHLWLTTPYFDLEKAVKNSIMPNPILLANFWWAGECFSSYQGWSEGALETADLVLNDFYNNKVGYSPIYKTIPKNISEWMLFDNRILDVKRWKNVHPGSKEAIVNHLKEDISKLFRYIKHSELSWAALYSVQIGYLK